MPRNGVMVFITKDLLKAIKEIRDKEGLTTNKTMAMLLDLGAITYQVRQNEQKSNTEG